MQVNALASGSSGNSYLVRSGATSLLVEAGLPASRLVTYLTALGVDPRGLSGILLTHAHSDHSQGASDLSNRFGVPIYATAGTLGHRALRDSRHARPIPPGRRFEVGELEILPFSVPHDCVEPVGFRLVGASATACITTDLGFVPDAVLPNLLAADLLVLEANHDLEMLWHGPYPPFLKRRVAGEHGHLSNLAAARCLASLERRPPRAVWLAHLSQANNSPATALRVVRDELSNVGLAHVTVEAAARNRPSLRWSAEPVAKQLSLL